METARRLFPVLTPTLPLLLIMMWLLVIAAPFAASFAPLSSARLLTPITLVLIAPVAISFLPLQTRIPLRPKRLPPRLSPQIALPLLAPRALLTTIPSLLLIRVIPARPPVLAIVSATLLPIRPRSLLIPRPIPPIVRIMAAGLLVGPPRPVVSLLIVLSLDVPVILPTMIRLLIAFPVPIMLTEISPPFPGHVILRLLPLPLISQAFPWTRSLSPAVRLEILETVPVSRLLAVVWLSIVALL